MTPTVDFGRDVHCVMGLPIDALDAAPAVERVRRAAMDNRRCFVSTPNLNWLMTARTDAGLRRSVLISDMSLPDGMPLIWVSRLLRIPIHSRVSGAGLFERLMRHDGAPLGVFFFGGPAGAAEAACRRINQAGSGLRCVGFDDAGHGTVESMSNAERLTLINRSGAQLLVVALGAQKGQAWIVRNQAHLSVPVLCHLGAVINFAAGTMRRAPLWMQAIGLEWLWRIKEEPALWRRYGYDGARFASLFATRVLPHALRLRLSDMKRAIAMPPAIQIDHRTDETTLELGGAWGRSNLQPLREALARAAGVSQRLVVGMRNLQCIDSAFLGLMLLARGAFLGAAGLTFRDVPAPIAEIFRQHCAEFLLESGEGS